MLPKRSPKDFYGQWNFLFKKKICSLHRFRWFFSFIEVASSDTYLAVSNLTIIVEGKKIIIARCGSSTLAALMNSPGYQTLLRNKPGVLYWWHGHKCWRIIDVSVKWFIWHISDDYFVRIVRPQVRFLLEASDYCIVLWESQLLGAAGTAWSSYCTRD